MQIHYAAWHGDREAVQKQLARGIPIDVRDKYEGETPLCWAAGSPSTDTVFLDFLIAQGADVNAVTTLFESTPLMAAAQAGSAAKVSFLLDAGADVRFRNANGFTALISSMAGSLEVAGLLLKAGANPEGKPPLVESALSLASCESAWPMVRLLLDAGADPAPLRWTPLMRAVVFGSLADVTAEVDAGDVPVAEKLAARDRWERTPWLHAVCAGDIEKARLLLERGSDIRAVGWSDDTALMYAAKRDDVPMVRWLLTLGLDVDAANPLGETALHAAAERGAVRVIPVLLETGADVRVSNHVKRQPINLASNIETARLLVAAGADIEYVEGPGSWLLKAAAGDAEFTQNLIALGASVNTTSTGETALHEAVKADALDVVRLLLSAGADPNAQDVDGYGLLWYARTTEAVHILLDAGVDVHLADELGREALRYHTDTEIQGQLISAGCYVNPMDTTYGTPLLEAVENGTADQIRFLLDAGADVHATTDWGQNALMAAAEISFAEAISILLGAGGDAGARDRHGRTVLHHAAAPEAFIAYTLALKATSPAWRSVLDEVLPDDPSAVAEPEPIDMGRCGYVESDSVECLGLLVGAGADLNAPDAAGITPLMLAASSGRASRVAGLLALGADTSRRDADGRTALDHAETHPREDQRDLILSLLREVPSAETV